MSQPSFVSEYPFATPVDIERAWRPLSAEETVRATRLLAAAARWIRRRRPDIEDGDADAQDVCIEVVKGALVAGEHLGHSSYSRALGPRSRAGTLTNPDAALVWADWMKEQLGISITAEPRSYFGDGDFRERW